MNRLKKLGNTIRNNSDISIIMTIGTVLRLLSITKDDLWFDEAITGLTMRIPLERITQLIRIDPHPPLYSLINKLWSLVLGVNDLTLRLLPALFGILTILIVYLLAKDFFNKQTALISAFLIAINPFLIGYSNDARSYSFYGFLATATLYVLYKKRFNLFILGTICLIFTHYFSFLYIPFLFLYYLFLATKDGHSLKSVLLRLGTFFIVFLIIFILGILVTLVTQEPAWAGKATALNIPKSVGSYVLGVQVKQPGQSQINDTNLPISKELLVWLTFSLYIVGAVITLIKTGKAKQRDSRFHFMYLLILTLVPQAAVIIYGTISGKSLYVERYLIPSSIFFLITVAFVLNQLLRFEVMFLVVIGYVLVLGKVKHPDYYYGMKLLVEQYRNFSGDIVFTSPSDYTVGKYYFGYSKESENRIKIYDPQNPDWTYDNWLFIGKDLKPVNWKNTIIITPQDSRMTEEFTKYTNESFGTYKVYTGSGAVN